MYASCKVVWKRLVKLAAFPLAGFLLVRACVLNS